MNYSDEIALFSDLLVDEDKQPSEKTITIINILKVFNAEFTTNFDSNIQEALKQVEIRLCDSSPNKPIGSDLSSRISDDIPEFDNLTVEDVFASYSKLYYCIISY